jgi:molybdenum cofactor biosynthesis protein B
VNPAPHRSGEPTQVGFALLVPTDSRSEVDDATSPAVRARVEAAGHRFVEGVRTANDEAAIRREAARLLEVDGVDVLVVSGGTGFSPRDVTVDALCGLAEREAPGFGEAFRRLSFDQPGGPGAMALLSRAFAASVGRKCLFVLPGSPSGVALALDQLILPTVAHWLGQLRRGDA